MDRLFRVFVCFLLICTLLVNISPIRAEASAAVATGVLVPALPVLGQIVLGLGVIYGTDRLLYDLVDVLTQEGIIDDNGMMQGYDLGDGVIGISAYFIESLHYWLFDSGVLVDPVMQSYGTLAAKETFSLYDTSPSYYSGSQCEYFRVFYRYTSGTNSAVSWGYLLFAPTDFYCYRSSGGDTSHSNAVSSLGLHYIYRSNAKSFTSTSKYESLLSGLSGYIDITQFRTATGIDIPSALSYLITLEPGITLGPGYEDMELGFVGGSLEYDYGEWVENGVPVGEDYVLPIGTIADTPATNIPQEDVWDGTAPIVVPVPGVDTFPDAGEDTEDETVGVPPGSDVGTGDTTFPDSGVLQDILTGVESVANAIATTVENVITEVRAIPAAIADVFTPSADFEHFSISLSDYFPFCIPFDLYDFFSCLNADPVAPVIDWEIPLPTGGTYPVKLDLSVFDPVASLLRTLQLLLFCVGLAFKTRDLIKG